MIRIALPAALVALLLGGCTVVNDPASPAYSYAPASPAYSYAPAGPAYSYSGAPTVIAPVQGGGYAGAATVDPYCREALAEARDARRDARMAARDARLGSYAGAPPWAQAQDNERAATAAARADRTRAFGARDC